MRASSYFYCRSANGLRSGLGTGGGRRAQVRPATRGRHRGRIFLVGEQVFRGDVAGQPTTVTAASVAATAQANVPGCEALCRGIGASTVGSAASAALKRTENRVDMPWAPRKWSPITW